MGLHITRIAQVLIESGDKWIQLIPAHFYYDSQYNSGFDGPIVYGKADTEAGIANGQAR